MLITSYSPPLYNPWFSGRLTRTLDCPFDESPNICYQGIVKYSPCLGAARSVSQHESSPSSSQLEGSEYNTKPVDP
jgi:hypothetical protein